MNSKTMAKREFSIQLKACGAKDDTKTLQPTETSFTTSMHKASVVNSCNKKKVLTGQDDSQMQANTFGDNFFWLRFQGLILTSQASSCQNEGSAAILNGGAQDQTYDFNVGDQQGDALDQGKSK